MPYEILALSGKPYRPSNGTEGGMFQHVWCDRCTQDWAAREGRPEDGCRLIALALALAHDVDSADYPAEWTHDERGRPVCSAFDPEADA